MPDNYGGKVDFRLILYLKRPFADGVRPLATERFPQTSLIPNAYSPPAFRLWSGSPAPLTSGLDMTFSFVCETVYPSVDATPLCHSTAARSLLRACSLISCRPGSQFGQGSRKMTELTFLYCVSQSGARWGLNNGRFSEEVENMSALVVGLFGGGESFDVCLEWRWFFFFFVSSPYLLFFLHFFSCWFRPPSPVFGCFFFPLSFLSHHFTPRLFERDLAVSPAGVLRLQSVLKCRINSTRVPNEYCVLSPDTTLFELSTFLVPDSFSPLW